MPPNGPRPERARYFDHCMFALLDAVRKELKGLLASERDSFQPGLGQGVVLRREPPMPEPIGWIVRLLTFGRKPELLKPKKIPILVVHDIAPYEVQNASTYSRFDRIVPWDRSKPLPVHVYVTHPRLEDVIRAQLGPLADKLGYDGLDIVDVRPIAYEASEPDPAPLPTARLVTR